MTKLCRSLTALIAALYSTPLSTTILHLFSSFLSCSLDLVSAAFLASSLKASTSSCSLLSSIHLITMLLQITIRAFCQKRFHRFLSSTLLWVSNQSFCRLKKSNTWKILLERASNGNFYFWKYSLADAMICAFSTIQRYSDKALRILFIALRPFL